MIVRSIAEFRSTLEEDWVEDEQGNFLQDPGEPVAIALSEMLRRLGYDADAPGSLGEFGWNFGVRIKGHPSGCYVICGVSVLDGCRLHFWNPSWWDKVRKRHPAPYLEALRALAQAMNEDPRFSEVQWLAPTKPGEDDLRSPEPVTD